MKLWKSLLASMALCAATSAPALANDTQCSDQILSGSYDTVIVMEGKYCTLIGATLSGDFIVGKSSTGGARGGTTIGGNVKADEATTVSLREVAIGGNVDIKKTLTTRLFSTATVNGNVKVEEQQAAVNIAGAIVGNLEIVKSNNGVTVSSASVQGNVIVKEGQNSAPSITGNTIGGNLECYDNNPAPYHSSNTVTGSRLGQCSP